MKSKLKLILASLSAAVLMACGGGGGGGAGDGGGGGVSAATRSFGTAEIISTAGSEAGTGDVALAADGSGYAVWIEDVGGFKVVRARRFLNGVPQEPVVTVSSNPAAVEARAPQVALSAGGEAVAVWTEKTLLGGGVAVKGARTQNNGKWEAPVLVQPLDGATEVVDLDVVGNGQGLALAVWSREVAQDTFTVFGAGFTNGPAGGGFLDDEKINPGTTSAQFPSVAMNASGQALVAWVQSSGGPDGVNRIRVRPYANNALSNDIFEFNGGQVDANFPKVAVASDGRATVVWEQSDGNGGQAVGFVTSTNFLAGAITSWRPVKTLPSVEGVEKPAVALDSQGVSTVVWIAGSTVRASRFSVDPTPSEALETDDAGDSFQSIVATDAAGVVVVLWLQDVNPTLTARTKPFANRFNPATGKWGQPERIDAGVDADQVSVQNLSLSMNASGQALALWTRAGNTGDLDGIAVNALK